MQITKEVQKILADRFNQAKSVDSFKKEMTKIKPMEKLEKSMKHRKVMQTLKGK